MKLRFLNYAAIAIATTIASCSSDDDNVNETKKETKKGTNSVTIEFDNGVKGDDLILDSSTYTNSNGEKLTINGLSYIVSNFVLIDDQGNEYTYPKDESYFIINEKKGKTEITLNKIPAGNYVSMRFGLGVDQEKYLKGAKGQGNFLAEAEAQKMLWAWQSGYKFLRFEGTFTSATVKKASNFNIHMGSHGSSLDNYKKVSVSFPSKAIVSDDMSPLVHFKVDANMILDGANKIKLSEGPRIMIDETKSPKIAENAATMFKVDHIHNGKKGHHHH